MTVYRLSESAESASRLGRKSAEAESVIGRYKVSGGIPGIVYLTARESEVAD